MADSDYRNLKDIANATADRPVRANANPVEIPKENSNPNPLGLDDEPVIITGRAAKESADMPPEMAALMETPTPRKPVPIDTGLSMEDLEAPTAPIQNPNKPSTEGTEDIGALYSSILFKDDGQYSEGQLALMEKYFTDIPVDKYDSYAEPIFGSIADETKLMVTQLRMSVTEAQKAVYDRTISQLQDTNEKYKKDHPESAKIIIDKSGDINDLGLTQEEHAKLQKVKKVQLVLLEDADLLNIELEHPSEEHKSDYIKSIEGSISKYSVPLPMLGDFVSFNGAQIIQMMNIIQFEDSNLVENINLKASLIYDKISDASILKKFNEHGKSVMSYIEFTNKFPYQDIDMALFGILCASSMEDSVTSLTCQSCNHTWSQTYNLKSLLKMDDMPEYYKSRTEEILANKSNPLELRRLYEERHKVMRYKSPFTNNIYDLSYPSIARATDILSRIDEKDAAMMYLSAIALYMNQILIYNAKTGKYVPISIEEVKLMLDTMKNLPNEDINLLTKMIREKLAYSVKFMMDVECPSCHKKANPEISINDLIFLKAQDFEAEIE